MCYSAAVCCIFLCELDAKRYQQEIQVLLQGMFARQLQNGCWGYKPHKYDDTSQSQYGALCLWSAHAAGFNVSPDSVERAVQWFVYVQSRDGSWAYDYQTGKSSWLSQAPTHGMTAAGLGSVYVCAHLLGLTAKVEQRREAISKLPPALRPAVEEVERKFIPLTPTRTSYATLKNAMDSGNAWFQTNGFGFEKERWTYYYLYGLERCMSFRELVEGITDYEPTWYNEGVEFLKTRQTSDGSWSAATEPAVGTAFGILFLKRSTQQTLKKATEEGRLIGGKTLPDDLTQIRLNSSGQVIDTRDTPPIEDLLSMLEDEDGPQGDFMEGMPSELDLLVDPKTPAEKRALEQQLARLRRLARNGSFQARLTAVKTIGRYRSLDNVPVLIFALSDPDWRIQKAARDGLRFTSRKFAGFGMPEKPNSQQATAAQEKWKQWYLSIKPDGSLIE
jgi:hypothetical protein